MTENKRFNFNIMFGEDEYTGTVFENGKILKTTDVVYLLNKLWKENEQLKSTNMEMEDYIGRLEKRIIELEKENESIQNKLYDLIYYFIIKYDIDMEEIKLYLNGGNLK